MTPRQKATELLQKFINVQMHGISSIEASKRAAKCVLITVDEIMRDDMYIDSQYWNEVKTEIENIL